MEGAVIEQNYPGTNAVSTVRYVERNNAEGGKTFYATADNYFTNVYYDVDFQNGWSSDFINGRVPYVLAKAEGPWSLVIPQDGMQQVDQLLGNGHFEISDGSISALISTPNYVLNGGYPTSPTFADADKDPTVKNGTDGPPEGNPESTEPIDLYTGAYVHDHEDLSLGGTGARGLHFSRHYSTDLRGAPSDLGSGWNHSGRSFLTEYTDTSAAFGRGTPIQAATMIASCYALYDFMLNESGNAKGWVVSSIVADWAMRKNNGNTLSATAGRKNYLFSKLADGSFAASAGLGAQLIKDSANGLYRIEERFGQTNFFDAKLRLCRFVDADNKALTYNYDADSGKLTQMQDCYGRSLSFAYTSTNSDALMKSASDSTGRSVTYTYDDKDRLYTTTDPEGYTTTFFYEQPGSRGKHLGRKGKICGPELL